MEVLSDRIQECLGSNPNLMWHYHELRAKQTLPLGIVLSTGRSGTRALSLFMHSAPRITSLHRLYDVAEFQDYDVGDRRTRNTIIYSFLLGKYSQDWLEEQIRHTLGLLGHAIEYSNKTSTEFWYSAHRWNCYYPIIRALFHQHKLVYLSRDPFETIYSMIVKEQYAHRDAAPNVERIWINFELMDTKILRAETLKLTLTSAPQFDRIAWYTNFVKYLYFAFQSKFTGIAHCEFSIDAASKGSKEAYERLQSVANLEGVDYGLYREFFSTKVNVKSPKLSTALRFPEVEKWNSKLISRYEDISGAFTF